ncbi:TPA: hypothetical protein QH438_004742 [Klebsiella michiganensis]|nr:hypothetical protein [Klebsiella michiganensis]
MIIFWDFVKENVEIIGTLATSLAFLATAWAAYEARSSAKAAMKATQLTADSLIEMKKNSFKEWFEMLLEQHNKMLVDVNQILKEDKEIKVKLDINIVKGAYYHLTKKLVLIKYINHIISILSYIDKDFYLPSSASDERKSYVQNLRNSISSEVNLIIAIFGLNIDNNKSYDAKKLSILLNKFYFFENELFFNDAISQIHHLDDYTAKIFDNEYRKIVESYIDKMVENHDIVVTPPDIRNVYSSQRITLAVIWSYANPCKNFLLKRFNDLPQHMRARIELNMDKSFEEVEKFDSSLSGYVGWEFKIWDNTLKTIENVNYIKRLIKISPRYIKNQKMRGVLLTNGYNKLYDDQIRSALSKYTTWKAYAMLKSNPRKKEIIDGIVSNVEKMVDIYNSELNKFIFQ